MIAMPRPLEPAEAPPDGADSDRDGTTAAGMTVEAPEAVEPSEALAGDADEDGGDEPADPAALAGRWHRDAGRFRADAARLAAEAQAEINRIAADAQAEAVRLEAEAREADEQAAVWEKIARRDAAIVAAEAEVTSLAASRDTLAAEAERLDAEIAELSARLDGLAAAKAEAEQRRYQARLIGDVTEAVAAVKDAQATLAAIAEAVQHPAQRMAAAEARLAEIRGPADGMQEIRGPGGELIRGVQGEIPVIVTELGRVTVRLADLRRQAEGLPPLEERQEILGLVGVPLAAQMAAAAGPEEAERVTAALAAWLPEGPDRDGFLAAVAEPPERDSAGMAAVTKRAAVMTAVYLTRMAGWLDLLAVSRPDAYAALRDGCMRVGTVTAPEVMPSVRERLADPALTLMSDGTMRWESGYQGWGRIGHVPVPYPAEHGGGHG